VLVAEDGTIDERGPVVQEPHPRKTSKWAGPNVGPAGRLNFFDAGTPNDAARSSRSHDAEIDRSTGAWTIGQGLSSISRRDDVRGGADRDDVQSGTGKWTALPPTAFQLAQRPTGWKVRLDPAQRASLTLRQRLDNGNEIGGGHEPYPPRRRERRVFEIMGSRCKERTARSFGF